MQRDFGSYQLDDAPQRFDYATCHAWLTTAYWSTGIPRADVELAFRSSTLIVGAYAEGVQVGCLRVLSDRARFAMLFDVYVAPEHRGRGLGRALVSSALEHALFARVFIWMLGTLDAHGVYAPLGFAPLENPERLMRRSGEPKWRDVSAALEESARR